MEYVLRYAEPAKEWVEALPVGNGRLGAMVYGGVPTDEIQLNEETVWEGSYIDRINPKARESLSEIQRLIFQGHEEEATVLAEATYLSEPNRVGAFQPLASLHLDLLKQWPNEYSRELDLMTGIMTICNSTGDLRCRREVFASAVDQVVVVRLEATGGTVDVRARLDRAQDATFCRATEDDLTLRGRLGNDGVRFQAQARISVDGDPLQPRGNGVVISNASTITFVITGATSYVSPTDLSADPARRCAETLKDASAYSYDELKARHIAEHRPWMERVSLDLGSDGSEAQSIESRLAGISELTGGPHNHTIKPLDIDPRDPAMYALVFQYCRYLLLSDSRPGCQPGNLQGLWNEKLNPAWASDYHPNINLQMHYWPAEVCNLSECHEPLFDWLEALKFSGERTARDLYGAGGWTMHHVGDVFANTAPIGGLCGVWPVGGAWLCSHLWEHYLFTGDTDFLRDRAWPLMRDAARFLLDFLVEAPDCTVVHGKLVTAPSHSPENTFRKPDGTTSWLTYAATMDNQIIRELFLHNLQAMDDLGLDEPAFRRELEHALARLPEDQISEHDGRLQEWIEDYDEPEPGHRHISHMYALHPSDQIDIDATPELAAAARKSIEHRLSHDYAATGWSLPWLSSTFARLRDGDKAWEMLTYRLGGFTMPNLFSNAHGQPQVGDALGFAAGIAEMLLQSHRGVIQFLPALPSAWPDGCVNGLRARGGFEVDLRWKSGKLEEATLRSLNGATCRIRGSFDVSGTKTTQAEGKTLFPTEKGNSYTLRPC